LVINKNFANIIEILNITSFAMFNFSGKNSFFKNIIAFLVKKLYICTMIIYTLFNDL